MVVHEEGGVEMHYNPGFLEVVMAIDGAKSGCCWQEEWHERKKSGMTKVDIVICTGYSIWNV